MALPRAAKFNGGKIQTDRVAQPPLGHTFARECTMIPFEHSQSSGLDSACRQVGGGRVSGAATGRQRRQDGMERDMIRSLGAFIFLGLAATMPVQQAAAQDVLGGAIVGGALGGILGGALGRGGGAIAGAAIGATTGAVIAAEAQRRSSGYYWWRGGCYYRYPNGAWLQVQPGYCAY